MKIANQALISISSQVVWGAQSFITFLIASRELPQTQLGYVVIGNALIFGLQCLILGPVTNPTLRFGSLSRKALHLTHAINAAISAIVCAVLIVFASDLRWLMHGEPEAGDLIRFLSLPFAATSLYLVEKLVLFARGQYHRALAMDLIFLAANVAGLLSLASVHLPESAMSFYGVRSAAAFCGLATALLLHYLAPRPQPVDSDPPFHGGDYFEHSKYSSLAMLGTYGQGQIDTLAVGHFLSPACAAEYGIGKLFFAGMAMITTGLTMVAIPVFSRLASAGTQSVTIAYKRTLLAGYCILLPLAAILAIFASPIAAMCFGERYSASVPIIRIFCLAALVLPFNSITDAVANGVGWFRQASAAAIAGAVVGVAASIFLTSHFADTGAAASPLLALAGSSIVLRWLTSAHLPAGRITTGVLSAPTQAD